jgi:hypothetical protein
MITIGSCVIGDMLFITCHLILSIYMWMRVTGYTHPGNAY